ncbi:MAG: anti-sigma factor domain-containing protein [Dehalococcoidia bacterium]
MAALYALQSLTAEEQSDYLGHLEVCQLCRRLVSQFQEVTDFLPETLEPEDPSPLLKERILEQASLDLEADQRIRDSVVPQPRDTQRRSWLGWLAPVPAGALAVLVLAVAGLIAWNVVLSLRTGDQAATLAEQNQLLEEQARVLAQQTILMDGQSRILADQGRLLEAITVGAVPVDIPGTGQVAGARAVLVQEPGSGKSFLIIRGLPQAPPGMEYQVWSIAGGGNLLQGVGTFNITVPEGQLVVLPVDFSGAEQVGVSVEPQGGSEAPTGDIVLLGDL